MNKVDLLLIKPGKQELLYGDLSSSLHAVEPPLWAGLLAGYIRKHGFSVQIIDSEAENLSPEETAAKVAELNPLLAGVVVSGTNPSASTMNMAGATEILIAIRRKALNVKMIIAGLHPSALPEKTLAETDVDFLCQGEGFYTFHSLLNEIKSGNKKHDLNIEGLWYKINERIVSNPRAPLVKNLDEELPFVAWDLLPMDKYRAHNWHCFNDVGKRQPYAVIYTSLGCPFKCYFCCINTLFGAPGIRHRSPKSVVEEIDLLVKNYRMKNIKIIDELFVSRESHVIEICDLIIERGYDLNMWAYARIDTVNEKLVRKMKRAGINWLAFGIESGAARVREGVAKKFNQDKIKKAVEMARAAGIYVLGNFIFGLPDDDFETMGETLKMAMEFNFEYANFYVAMAYPGSKLYEDAVARGLKLPDTWQGYSQFSEDCLPLPTKYLTAAEVLSFRDEAFIKYHLNTRYLEMMENTFGKETADHIRDMCKIKLRRKYA